MRPHRVDLSEKSSLIVRSTTLGALLVLSFSTFEPKASAQASALAAIDEVQEASEAFDATPYEQPPRVYEVKDRVRNGVKGSASDDPIRDALREAFKESRPQTSGATTQPAPVSVAKTAAKNVSTEAKKTETPEKETLTGAAVASVKEKIADKPSEKSADESGDKTKLACSGVADFYADMFHGKKTASGQVHDKTKMTAAHLTLPFGTKLKVVNRKTGKSCVVTVNDRGPFTKNRIIDLSLAAAKELGLITASSRLVDCYMVDAEH